ncbi:hypothetical protein [Aequorivita echinoideorum]|uniref:DUF4890 domain-containing protein n=1 Tax=Aequorivita echinoideorum TaxID=1549647 RepID=A0ABS5S6N3_9FLAO|nr:hypothetical protein [Aequorivita echinoideorum]MBT0607510.1 hypothetical protein [Aequorivita echinoideorum]
MKNVIVILMVLATFGLNAQNEKSGRMAKRAQMEKYTPEQKAELRSKQMALKLDLNEAQQAKVKQILVENSKTKPERSKNWKEMSSEEKFKAKNDMLDRRIALKKKMKEILTEEQFAKMERDNKQRRNHFKKRRSGEQKGRK